MEERTMTIGDFVKEAALYDMSKEHFDFVKECGELQLMEIYAESVDYVTEHAELGNDELGMLVTEAATDSDKEGIGAKIKAKAGKIWQYIVKLCKKVAKAVVSFFGTLTRVFPKKRTESIKSLEEACSAAIDGLDDESKKAAIIAALEKAITNVTSANEDNKDACGEIKAVYTCSRYPAITKFLKKLATIDGVDKEAARRVIGIMISSIDDKVTVSIPELTVVNEELMETATKAFEDFANIKKADQPDAQEIAKICSEVEGAVHKINKAKIRFVKTKIDLTEEALTAKTKELEDLKTKIDGYIQSIQAHMTEANDAKTNPNQQIEGDKNDKAKGKIEKVGSTDRYSTVYSALQDLLVRWQESTANTISTYNKHRNVIMTNISALKDIVEAAK